MEGKLKLNKKYNKKSRIFFKYFKIIGMEHELV